MCDSLSLSMRVMRVMRVTRVIHRPNLAGDGFVHLRGLLGGVTKIIRVIH